MHVSTACVVLLLGFLLASPSVAQQAQPQQPPGREEPATKFEQFVLTKGTVRVREYHRVGKLRRESGGEATFEVARAYTPGKKDYILALRVEVTETGPLARNRIGVLDAEEVTALATVALPQIAKMLETMKETAGGDSTEVEFRGGSLRVGFFVAGARRRLFIQAGDIGAVSAFFDVSDFQELQAAITQADAKIKELGQP